MQIGGGLDGPKGRIEKQKQKAPIKQSFTGHPKYLLSIMRPILQYIDAFLVRQKTQKNRKNPVISMIYK
ncbi:hypothetical protein KKA47_02495 [bacterium]|nr:hypothetical protein [bacterium]